MRKVLLRVERVVRPAPGHAEIICRAAEGMPEPSPGQFFMLQPEGVPEAMLPRAFSFYRLDGEGGVSFLLHEVGPGTRRLANLTPGDLLPAFGPLGRAFPMPPRPGRAILVGGGVGIPPLWLLARRLRQAGHDVTVLIGARSADLLLGVEDFQELRVDVQVATDDGSAGHRGRVTELLQEDAAAWYACGPEPMLLRVQQLARSPSAPPAWLALEAPMGCGYGVCMGCVVERSHPDPALGDYGRFARVCREGPVFAAAEVSL